MSTLSFVGILITINFLLIGVYLLVVKGVSLGGFFVIALVGIGAGVIIANIEVVKRFTVSKEQGLTLETVREVKEKAAEVSATADEVERVKEAIDLLVRDANITKRQVDEAAEGVTTAQKSIQITEENLRGSAKLFIESYYLSLGTRNIFPIPAEVSSLIDQNLNRLAEFAVPDPVQRQAWVSRMNAAIKKAQGQ